MAMLRRLFRLQAFTEGCIMTAFRYRCIDNFFRIITIRIIIISIRKWKKVDYWRRMSTTNTTWNKDNLINWPL